MFQTNTSKFTTNENPCNILIDWFSLTLDIVVNFEVFFGTFRSAQTSHFYRVYWQGFLSGKKWSNRINEILADDWTHIPFVSWKESYHKCDSIKINYNKNTMMSIRSWWGQVWADEMLGCHKSLIMGFHSGYFWVT